MRHLSFAVSTLLLLSPLAAFAAYTTPGELVTSVQNGTPRSFSVTAHAVTADKTYVSVWANGTTQGTDPITMQMSTKATVDVVSGDMKIRVRAELMTVSGVLYAKLTNVSGGFNNALTELNGKLEQKQWMSLPFDEAILRDMIGTPAFSLGSAGAMEADTMLNLASKEGKNGTTYTLTLKPDAAAELALSLREMLQDDSSVSDDFFPWRALAEGMHFEMTIQTKADGSFLSSGYSMSTKGTKSEFSLTGTEKPAATLALTAPKNTVTLDEAMDMLSGNLPIGFMPFSMPSSSMMTEEEMPMMMQMEMPSTMDMMDTVDAIDMDCSETDPMKLVMMQRNGLCPIMKATTRHRGW